MILIGTKAKVIAVTEKVVRLKILKRNAKGKQSVEGSLGIFCGGANEDVKVIVART